LLQKNGAPHGVSASSFQRVNFGVKFPDFSAGNKPLCGHGLQLRWRKSERSLKQSASAIRALIDRRMGALSGTNVFSRLPQ
jgi:hypothetical protein